MIVRSEGVRLDTYVPDHQSQLNQIREYAQQLRMNCVL
jgi:hypothetical protein